MISKLNKPLRITIFSITGLLVLWLTVSFLVLFLTPGSLFNNQVSWAPVPNYGYELNFLELEDDTRVSMWYLNGNGPKTILYLHGNAGRLSNLVTDLAMYGDVYSPSYPGYGESEGNPSPETVLETAVTAFDYLVEDKQIPAEDIIIFGHSMGGSPAVYLASQRPEAGKLIVANTFSSVQSMCFRDFSIFCVFNGGILNSAKYAEEVEIPVRVFAYKGDTTVPFEEGEKLYEYFDSTEDKKFIAIDKYTHSYLDFQAISKELV